MHQLLGDTNVVIPERVVVWIHPRISLLVMPDRAIGLTDRPRRIHLRGCRILEHDDARRRENVVSVHGIQQRTDIAYDAVARALVLPKFGVRRVKVQPELVLHVDHESVDLGRIGDADEPTHASRALRREAIDVESTNDRRGGRIAERRD